MGEVGVGCSGDEDEGEGERVAPDGVPLVSLCFFVLRFLNRGRGGLSLGTVSVPRLETLIRGKTLRVTPVSNAFADVPQLGAPLGSGETLTHASRSFVF